jgi:hypothetical protein
MVPAEHAHGSHRAVFENSTHVCRNPHEAVAT